MLFQSDLNKYTIIIIICEYFSMHTYILCVLGAVCLAHIAQGSIVANYHFNNNTRFLTPEQEEQQQQQAGQKFRNA